MFVDLFIKFRLIFLALGTWGMLVDSTMPGTAPRPALRSASRPESHWEMQIWGTDSDCRSTQMPCDRPLAESLSKSAKNRSWLVSTHPRNLNLSSWETSFPVICSSIIPSWYSQIQLLDLHCFKKKWNPMADPMADPMAPCYRRIARDCSGSRQLLHRPMSRARHRHRGWPSSAETARKRPEVAHSTGFRLGKDELLKDMEGIYIYIILYYIILYYIILYYIILYYIVLYYIILYYILLYYIIYYIIYYILYIIYYILYIIYYILYIIYYILYIIYYILYIIYYILYIIYYILYIIYYILYIIYYILYIIYYILYIIYTLCSICPRIIIVIIIRIICTIPILLSFGNH